MQSQYGQQLRVIRSVKAAQPRPSGAQDFASDTVPLTTCCDNKCAVAHLKSCYAKHCSYSQGSVNCSKAQKEAAMSCFKTSILQTNANCENARVIGSYTVSTPVNRSFPAPNTVRTKRNMMYTKTGRPVVAKASFTASARNGSPRDIHGCPTGTIWSPAHKRCVDDPFKRPSTQRTRLMSGQCSVDSDCPNPLDICKNGKCVQVTQAPPGGHCHVDSQCPQGYRCDTSRRRCVPRGTQVQQPMQPMQPIRAFTQSEQPIQTAQGLQCRPGRELVCWGGEIKPGYCKCVPSRQTLQQPMQPMRATRSRMGYRRF